MNFPAPGKFRCATPPSSTLPFFRSSRQPSVPSPDASEHDLFASYARDDNRNGRITAFVEALQAEHAAFTHNDATRKLKMFFDTKAIGGFDDWQMRIHDGPAKSRLLLAFLSPNYFASAWCRREWRTWIDTEITKYILSAGGTHLLFSHCR